MTRTRVFAALAMAPVAIAAVLLLPTPWLVAAAMVVFITAISNFGIPAVLGYQVSYHVMTTRIYRVLQQFYRADNFNAASAMSVVLLMPAVLCLWLKDRALQQG